MKDVDEAVAKIQQKYITAVSARDVKALVQLYDDKTRIFDAWGIWEYQGAAAWQIAIEGWLSSHPTHKLMVSFSGTSVHGNTELATMTAIVHYAGVSADGAQAHAMHNRITWVLKSIGHNLRIVHEHTSAPIGFEDMKAILNKPT